MKVECYTVGPLGANAYLITDEATGDCAVIDPGYPDRELIHAAHAAGEHLKAVLLTHGHWDHIAGTAELMKGTDAKLYLYKDEEPFLTDAGLNLSAMFTSKGMEPLHADVLLREGDEIKLGESVLHVMHTPGHTAGSCTFAAPGILFTGDTLFRESAGRTDFPTGSYAQMMQSLNQLVSLGGDARVYPGHEMETTLEHERNYNPFV